MLILEDSCEEICELIALIDFAIARRHHGLSTLITKDNLFQQKDTWPRRWAPIYAHCSLHISSWGDAIQHAQCTVLPRIRASWLVLKRNVCTPRSFIDRRVATNRRSIASLFRHRIDSFKVLYAEPTETVKTFGRWIHKFSPPSKSSHHFPTKAKAFSCSLA